MLHSNFRQEYLILSMNILLMLLHYVSLSDSLSQSVVFFPLSFVAQLLVGVSANSNPRGSFYLFWAYGLHFLNFFGNIVKFLESITGSQQGVLWKMSLITRLEAFLQVCHLCRPAQQLCMVIAVNRRISWIVLGERDHLCMVTNCIWSLLVRRILELFSSFPCI